jgi:hypothetical protein
MSSTDTLGPALSKRKLRTFGLVMAGACAAMTALLWWRGSTWLALPAVAGALFLGAALLLPHVLAPIEKTWMALARGLALVSTAVLLTLTFFLIVTPLGIFLRLIGKDLLAIRRNPTRTSYWVAVEKDGPCSRPERPY